MHTRITDFDRITDFKNTHTNIALRENGSSDSAYLQPKTCGKISEDDLLSRYTAKNSRLVYISNYVPQNESVLRSEVNVSDSSDVVFDCKKIED